MYREEDDNDYGLLYKYAGEYVISVNWDDYKEGGYYKVIYYFEPDIGGYPTFNIIDVLQIESDDDPNPVSVIGDPKFNLKKFEDDKFDEMWEEVNGAIEVGEAGPDYDDD